jgi:hypothetical protein
MHLSKIPKVVLKVTHWVWKESQTRLPGVKNVDSFENKFGNWQQICIYNTVLILSLLSLLHTESKNVIRYLPISSGSARVMRLAMYDVRVSRCMCFSGIHLLIPKYKAGT